MARIFGIYSTNYALKSISSLAKKIRDASIYEKWDKEEHIHNGTFLIGKVSHEQKEIFNKDGIIVIMTGNLIRKASNIILDEEYISKLYQHDGIDKLKNLNGSFEIALIDENIKTLYLLSDRMGSQPMYYYHNKDLIVFSSEIKSILASGLVDPEFNFNVLPNYLQTYERYLLGDGTFFRKVYMQPAATVMTFSHEGLKKDKYWEISFDRSKRFKPESYFKRFKILLKSSIKNCVKDKKNIGYLISGGLDSRYLAACLKEMNVETTAFCFGIKNGLQEKIVKKLADRLSIDYHFFELNGDFIRKMAKDIVQMGSGSMQIQDCHFIGGLEHIRNNFDIDVMLTGHFGGEMFGQMIPVKRFGIIPEKDFTFNILLNQYKRSTPFEDLLTNEILMKINKDHYHPINDYFSQRKIKYSITELADLFEFEERSRRYIAQLFRFIDWYFDVRRPFINNDLIDFALKLPYEMRAAETFYQKAMNYCFPGLTDIIWEHGECPPDSPAWKSRLKWVKRKGLDISSKSLEKLTKGKYSAYKTKLFSSDYRPYGNWLREKENEKFVRNLLLNEKTLNRGIFRKKLIEQTIEDHMSGKSNNDHIICDLINFEMMLREFFDK